MKLREKIKLGLLIADDLVSSTMNNGDLDDTLNGFGYSQTEIDYAMESYFGKSINNTFDSEFAQKKDKIFVVVIDYFENGSDIDGIYISRQDAENRVKAIPNELKEIYANAEMIRIEERELE